jgi:deoxyribodipyrimidine photo-lyase
MKKGLCWLRRDLRLHDHHALSKCLKDNDETYLVFVFDPYILDKLKDKKDRRVHFIIQSLQFIQEHAPIHILYGDPVQEIPSLMKKLGCESLYFNRDYEPYAKERDAKIKKLCEAHDFKDHVFYEADEVLKKDGTPYKVFTPYKNLWLSRFEENDCAIPKYSCNLKKLADVKVKKENLFKLTGFEECPPPLTGGTAEAKKHLKKFEKVMSEYDVARDFPEMEKTSNLSVYIRHGNLSIRDLLRAAVREKNKGSQVWLSELIWREFYQMILDKYPHVVKGSFKPQYDKIKWEGNPDHFKKWCEGKTGFPIVDAAMRCLNESGMMHNRLRMIVASFLCKTLLIDWRKGEKYFSQKLLDFDLAANNGGWQWASSSGCDAQPYFRIFNPYSQTEKFDPNLSFVKKWVDDPEATTPIVDYKKQRIKALAMYEVVKQK